METALTADGLARLIATPDTGLAQDEAAKGIIPALTEMLRVIPDLPPAFPIPEAFQSATAQFWWAEDSLAGFNRSSVEAAFALIREYNALSAGVGSAGNRQRFSEERDLKKRIQAAITELEKVKL
jgi:hypothetical protein